MAHCDFTYFMGLWDVIGKANEEFKKSLDPLAQVFSLSILNNAHKDISGDAGMSEVHRDLLREAYSSVLEEFAGHSQAIINGV